MNKNIFTALLFVMVPLLNLFAQTDSAGAGYALKFTGTLGSFVNVGDNLNSLTFPFTIEAWINLSGYPNVEGSIFSSDNAAVYSGFWFNVAQGGNLFIEFGDNVNAGQEDRRGYQTTATLPLHKWVHVAAVCNSITNIQFYFNGVLQNAGPTDGASGATVLFHNSGNAEIGDWLTLSRESPFLGQVDELRIWKTARTLSQIQQNMCARVKPVGALVGYWRGSGSIKGNVVTDYALVPHNGTITGGGVITKVISGAPVGDFSMTHFGSFINRSITLADPSGDSLKVSSVSGNPFGVSIYGVDQAPYRKQGLSSNPAHYFGVFCVENSIASTFKITSHYANGSIGGNTEADARIFSKATDSSITWTNTGSKPDVAANTITKSGLVTRGDFILNFIPSIMVLTQPVAASNEDLFVSPNPAHNNVSISFDNLNQPVSVIRIVNLTGKMILEIQNPSGNSSLNLDIANWSCGIYFAEAVTPKGNFFTRFLVE